MKGNHALERSYFLVIPDMGLASVVMCAIEKAQNVALAHAYKEGHIALHVVDAVAKK